MYLISVEGYTNAGGHLLRIKKMVKLGQVWTMHTTA